MNKVLTESKATAIGYARYGDEYLFAAKAVDLTLGEKPGYEIVSPMPAYFLAAHAIELLLKSYLLQCGYSDVILRNKFRHDLERLFSEAKQHGLCGALLSNSQSEELILLLAELNKYEAMRYMKRGEKEFPIWGSIQNFIEELRSTVLLKVGYTSVL